MAGIDLNRTSTGVKLTPEQSDEIWQDATKSSVVMQLARRVSLPGSGTSFDTLGEAAPAKWVGETDEKPVINPTVGSRILKPYKMARIITVSTEFARDKATLWNAIKAQAAESVAKTVDMTFLTGAIAAPSTDGMDTLADAQAVSLGKSAYADFMKVYEKISVNGGNLNGWAMSPEGQAKILGATDANGRPLITPRRVLHDHRQRARRSRPQVPVGPQGGSFRRLRRPGNPRRGRRLESGPVRRCGRHHHQGIRHRHRQGRRRDGVPVAAQHARLPGRVRVRLHREEQDPFR